MASGQRAVGSFVVPPREHKNPLSMSHRHKFYSTSYCIPSWKLVSYLFLLCKGKGRNIFTLSTKHQAMSLDIRCLFSLLFKQLELREGIQNPYIPLPVLTLPETFSHGNFKTRDNRLWNHLSNKEVKRIAGIMSVEWSKHSGKQIL